MKCHLDNREQLIAEYLTHELGEEEAERFEHHYVQCDVCFQELKAAEAAMNLIRQQGQDAFGVRRSLRERMRDVFAPQPATRHQKKRWRIILGTAGAVAVIAVVIVSLTGKPGGVHLTGPAFVPDPYYEEWVTESVRSDKEILEKVTSPGIGEQCTGEMIRFAWTMKDRVPVTLKILTNREREVFAAAPSLSEFPQVTFTVPEDSLGQPGLYYWRIEDESEVLFVGKFYVLP